jgi:hypothetical protein
MLTWQEKAKDLLSTLNIELSREQSDAFYREARLKIIAGGEGSGKSFLGALTGICRPIADAHTYNLDRQLIWIIGADFEDARKEFDYILDWAEDLHIVRLEGTSTPSLKGREPASLETTLGIRYETISAYDPRKIGREEPDGIIGAEVSRWGTTTGSESGIEIWRRVQGRLYRTFPRAWGFLSGSFEGSTGWFPEEFALGQGPNEIGLTSISLPTWANHAKYPGGRDHPAMKLAEATEPPARFMERYGGKPAPPQDAVLPEFRVALHVQKVSLDSQYPVYLFADPGGGPKGGGAYAVLMVQFVNAEIRVLDHVYVRDWTHEQVVNAIQLKSAWRKVGPYGHVMDVAGRYYQSGLSTPVQAWQESCQVAFVGEKRAVADQVEKLHSVLSLNPTTLRPYLQIHPRCSGLIAEMGGGPSPLPKMGIWRHKAGIPEKANNHACQALAYGLLHHFGAKKAWGATEGNPELYSYLSKASPKRDNIFDGPTEQPVSYLDRHVS